MDTQLGRTAMLWYLRFDVTVALMSGFVPKMERQWFDYMLDYYRDQAREFPHSLRLKMALASAEMRHMSMELSLIIAQANRGTISEADYVKQHAVLTVRIDKWRTEMDPALRDARYLVTNLEAHAQMTDEERREEIVDPFELGLLYGGPLFVMTALTVEWLSVAVMSRSQLPASLAATTQDRFVQYMDLARYARTTAQIYEAVELWSDQPKGALIPIHSALGFSMLFLPHDQKHHWWFRKKLALQEQRG